MCDHVLLRSCTRHLARQVMAAIVTCCLAVTFAADLTGDFLDQQYRRGFAAGKETYRSRPFVREGPVLLGCMNCCIGGTGVVLSITAGSRWYAGAAVASGVTLFTTTLVSLAPSTLADTLVPFPSAMPATYRDGFSEGYRQAYREHIASLYRYSWVSLGGVVGVTGVFYLIYRLIR